MAVTKPLYYWKFQGNGDSIVGSKDLTVSGATLAQGKIAYGYSFDGVNDVLSSASATLGIANIWSVSCWFKHSNSTNSRIMMARAGSTLPNLFGIFTSAGTGKIGVDLYASNGSIIKQYQSTSAYNDGNWHHIVATWDGLNLKLYFDGSEDTTVVKDNDNSGLMTDTARTIYWGNNQSSTNSYGGTLAEPSMWSSTLSSAEVTELYDSGKGLTFSKGEDDFIDDTDLRYALFNYYGFDSGDADDYLGVDDGVAVGTPTFVTSGKVAGSYDFEAGSSQAFNLDGGTLSYITGDRSYVCWIKREDNGVATRTIFSQGYTLGDRDFLTFGFNSSDLLFAEAEFSGANTRSSAATNATITDTNWHHVALTWNHTTKAFKLYIDGTEQSYLVNTTNAVGDLASQTMGFRGISRARLSTEYFDGEMDEFSIHHRILSDSEIADLYNSGTGKSYNQFSDVFYNGDDLRVGQMSYYTFDSDASDSHGDEDGTVTGATQTTGKINNGYNFDGTDDYIVTDNTLPGISVNKAFSVSLWLNVDTPFPTSAENVITHSVAANDRFALTIRDSGSAKRINPYLFSSGDVYFRGANITEGSWQHFVFTWDGSSTGTMYVNGSSQDNSGTSGITNPNITPLNFGRDTNSSIFYDGKLDEVGFWGRVLSSSDVTSLYNSSSGLQYPYVTITPETPVLNAIFFGSNF